MAEIEARARIKRTPPKTVSRESGQRSLDMPFFYRYLPPWSNPKDMLDGNKWRQVVAKQPVAIICRETLISNLIALDWKIEPRDSTQRDEHKSDIDYYEKFFEYTGAYDYVQILEWVCSDLLDIPFGAGIEVGREGDAPGGKVLWIALLDGATLFPTLNFDYPVGQKIPQLPENPVYFPKHAINRVYYSARREIDKEGWGIAPPEKIYLALELLNRGDVYYANLLLDTPQAGILDLGDMAKDSAEEWVKSWREMLGGIDPFKIPVLYEHEKSIDYIPFTRNPSELMFDKATLKYASVITAGYGITLSDIGVSTSASGGETLAGTIRQERQSRRTGYARLKKKVKYFFDRLLPDYLEFKFIDIDDELNVALGRARLATATAIQSWINTGLLSPEEGRQQLIADGLVTISIPEALPEEAKARLEYNAERPNMLGRPVSPSEGGYGEISPRSDAITKALKYDIPRIKDTTLLRLAYKAFPTVRSEVEEANSKELLADAVSVSNWLDWHELSLIGDGIVDIPELSAATMDYVVDRLADAIPHEEKLVEIDRDRAIEDIEEVIQNVLDEAMLSERRNKYIRGEIDNLEDDIITIENLVEVEELVDKFVEEIDDKIKKSIVYGVYRFAVYHQEIDDLIDSQYDLLTIIRKSIDKMCDILLSDIGSRVSDIIRNQIKEE